MTTQPTRTHPCARVWGGRSPPLPVFCSVSSARHTVISQALWEQGNGTILTPGPTSSSPDKGFFPTRKSCKTVKDQRVRCVKISPEAPVLPLLSVWVWSYSGCDALIGLVFTTGPSGAIMNDSLFISQISLKLIYRLFWVLVLTSVILYCWEQLLFWIWYCLQPSE